MARGGDDLAELQAKIDSLKMSKEAKAKANAELKKLRAMAPMSAEATVVRNYLDTLIGPALGQEVEAEKGHREGAGRSGRRPFRA